MDSVGIATAEIAFLCLPGAETVHSVLFGEGGLVARLGARRTVVDLSTLPYAVTTETAGALQAQNIAFSGCAVVRHGISGGRRHADDHVRRIHPPRAAWA
ncbi:MAG: NAD(P)-binding domain-containing protein [Janthinobacterium lividum]